MRTTANSAPGPWRKSSYSDDKGGDCVECATVGAAWRKSSHSGDTGGSCVECAALDGVAWRKSTRCNQEESACVEVGMPRVPATVAIRDSKDPDRGHLTFPATAFTAFIHTVAG